MRITGGLYRGRRLYGPRHPGLRPTAERVRKAVFDILGTKIVGAAVLDLFAGAGGLGFEALSRGAGRVVFVERDRQALALLRRNLEELGLREGNAVRIMAGDVRGVLPRLGGEGEVFDLVLADPPYGQGWGPEVLGLLVRTRVLAPGAVCVFEHASSEEVSAPAGLLKVGQRTYGDTAVSFFVPATEEKKNGSCGDLPGEF